MAIFSLPLALDGQNLCTGKHLLIHKLSKARKEILKILPFTPQYIRKSVLQKGSMLRDKVNKIFYFSYT